jgi:uncharacterized membrane protein (GlpM family)
MATGEPTEMTSPRDGETEDMLPARGTHAPPTIHHVNRRPLGIGPVPLLGGALLVLVLLAIVLLAIGSWIVGMILLACSVALLALLLVAVEREPEDPAARVAVSAAGHARSQTHLIGVAARAWSRAGVALLRVTQRRYRLRWQIRRQIEPIGEAAYQGDEAKVERLRAEALRLEAALHEAEREGSEVLDAARVEVERERATSEATQTLPAVEPEDPTQSVLKQP